MALIGEIRKRSWILIVFIGLGMGGFLLMDMIGQQSNLFGTSNTVGEIAGKEISITDFQRRQEELYGGSQSTQFQIREGLWQYYVRESILQTEAEALGISVSEDEFNELAYGPNQQNLSPIIRQAFGNQQTGQVDIAQLQNIKQRVESNQMQPEELAYWNTLTEQIKLDRLEDKILSIASHAIYTPTWMAEMEHNAMNRKADFRFVGIPYSTIKDEEVEVSDKELTNYIKENAGQFMVEEETRKFDYILFDVQPTAKDSADIVERLRNEVADLTVAEDDSSYIVNSLGGIYQETYELKDKLAPQIQDTVTQIPVGTVFGPYVDGSKYKLAKLVDKQIVPDSVKARHILRTVSQEQTSRDAYIAAMRSEIKTVDSLVKELNEGRAIFDSLVVNYSMDFTKSSGGDLGIFTQGQQPKELSDLVFFKAKTGEYNRVITQRGVHIVQVQRKYESGKMGYLVGYLTESIIPSSDTEKALQREAAKFAASLKDMEDMAAKAEKAGYTVQSTTAGARRNDYNLIGIGQGESTRDIIKWGFDADKGDASNEVYIFESTGEDIYVDKYAVVALRSIAEEGLANLDDAAARLRAETAVKNEKKAEIIKKKIEKGQALDAVATAFGVQVQTGRGVSTKTTNITGMGNEPKVAGSVFGMKVNQVSAPIAGNTGVYVIEPTFIPEPSTPGDLPAAKQQASAVAKQQVAQRLVESLRKQTEISDYRYRFF